MNSAIQERADAANDSYKNRSQNEVNNKIVDLNGQRYQVFGYANDPITGFHATAYQQVGAPHNIIIAYRGTDPALFSGKTRYEKVDHALTTLQDIAVDATMVRDTVNPQKAAADAFTKAMIDKAAQQGISKDHVFVAGHSLGGTLAEIEAAQYGLTGTTLNAYGAVGLTDGPPRPGCQLTNYVMAGDGVSAANHHIGTVVPLASTDDLQSLRAGRFLDVPAGARPPNPLLAMRPDDHSGAHFRGPDSVLAPAKLAQYEKNYADNKAAIDAYRSAVFHERGELSLALRQMQQHGGPQALPPDLQWQVNEYLAVHADPTVRRAIEQSGAAQGTEHGLQYGADAARAVGRYVQTQDERVAAAAREASVLATPLGPAGPLAGAILGEAAHLHGQAAAATGQFVGDQLQSTRSVVAQDARQLADAAVREIHDPGFQAGAIHAVNRVVDVYHDTPAAPAHSPSLPLPPHAQAIAPAAGYPRSDPRHPENPDHALFDELHRRIPEACENRLLQFTAACHAKGITDANLQTVHINEQNHSVVIASGGLTPQITAVDVSQPSPQPAQSIQQIQHFDAGQALLNQQIQQHIQQVNMQAQQGPVMGGPM